MCTRTGIKHVDACSAERQSKRTASDVLMAAKSPTPAKTRISESGITENRPLLFAPFHERLLVNLSATLQITSPALPARNPSRSDRSPSDDRECCRMAVPHLRYRLRTRRSSAVSSVESQHRLARRPVARALGGKKSRGIFINQESSKGRVCGRQSTPCARFRGAT
jgi:hypothetical protein